MFCCDSSRQITRLVVTKKTAPKMFSISSNRLRTALLPMHKASAMPDKAPQRCASGEQRA